MEQSKIERLDLAARTLIAHKMLLFMQIMMSIFSCFMIFVVVYNNFPGSEAWALRLTTGAIAITTLLLWLRWRYAFYALAFSWIVFVISSFIFRSDIHTLAGLIERGIFALSQLIFPIHLIRQGLVFADVRGRTDEEERLEAKNLMKLMEELRVKPEENSSLNIPSGSFWTGYFSYCLSDFSGSWIVGKFKTGSDRILELRVLSKRAVSLMEATNGKMVLRLDNKKIKNIAVSPELRQNLARFGIPVTVQ